MSTTTFEASFFSGNRQRLLAACGDDAPIVITANGLLQQSSDEAFPLYQDRDFWYLTGIDLPDALLVMDKGKEYLIVPDREAVRDAFDGAVDTAMLTNISGIHTVYGEKEGWKLLQTRLGKVKQIATLAAEPQYLDFWGIYTNPARATLARRLKEKDDSLELIDICKHLARMRMVKQPEEIVAIQKAIDVTIDAMKDVTKPRQLAKYAYEYEIEADLTRGFRRRGADGHAFTPIVASGKRACTLHHITNNAALTSGDLLVMDIGAAWSHYAADVTRTIVLGDKPSRRQVQVHRAVLEAQEYAFSLIKPGMLMKDYEKQVEIFIGEKLRALGLIKTIESETVRKYFPHATSHFLGLDAHDAGDYELPLEAGVVLAVEPGIYIPEEGIGVRIEDNVVVTSDGCKVLSGRMPRGLC